MPAPTERQDAWVGFRLPKQTQALLARMAEAEDKTVSEAVRDAIEDWMADRYPVGVAVPPKYWPDNERDALELYLEREAQLTQAFRRALEVIDAGGDLNKLIDNAK